MKQKVEKRKGSESPQEGSKSIIWENEEQSQGFESSQEGFESIIENKAYSPWQGIGIWISHTRDLNFLGQNFQMQSWDPNPKALYSNCQACKSVKIASFIRFETFSLSQWLGFFFQRSYLLLKV